MRTSVNDPGDSWTPFSNHSLPHSPPPLSLSRRSSVFSLFVCNCVCALRACGPISNCLYYIYYSQFSRGCVALIELRDLLRGIYVVELLHCYDCWSFFQERERERDIQYRRKLSIITRNIRIVWTGRFILSYVWKPILKRFVSIQYSRHYMHLIGMAALFVIVDIRALQTVRYRYIRFQVFHECSNWFGCDTGRDSNRWKHCMPIFYLEIENFLEKFLKYDWIRINRININTLIDQLYQYVTNDNITYSNYSSYYQIFRTNFKLPWLPITSLTISKILNSQLHQISN